MKLNIKVRVTIYLSMLIIALSIFHACKLNVFGQENGRITVSPALYEIHSARDDGGSLQATIKNDTEERVKVNLSIANIDVETLIQDDKLKLVNAEDPLTAGYWFSPEQKNVNIESSSEKTVKINYKIPENVELKSYYPVIVYEIEKDKVSDVDVNISDRIISIIYLDIAEVKGEFSFSSARISHFKPRKKIVFSPNVQFELRFENTGNTYIHPRGRVHIYDRKGMCLSGTPTINDKFGYLVQGETLEEVLSWVRIEDFRLIPRFGKYTAVAEIYHNSDQKNISTSETEFFILPIWHLLILLFLLIAIIGSVFYIVWRRRQKVL